MKCCYRYMYMLMAASIASSQASPIVFKSRHTTSGQFCRGLPPLCRVFTMLPIALLVLQSPMRSSCLNHLHGLSPRSLPVFKTNEWKKCTVRVNHISQINGNRSSVVAEMGDRLATIDMGWKVRGLLCPFSAGAGHLTQCRLGRDLYLSIKWYLDSSSRLATTGMGRKLGAVPLLGESWIPI